MSKKKLSKLLALYLPYVVICLLATNLGEAWRLAAGKELGDKIVSLMDTLPAAFSNPLPSLHPFDLFIGLCCGAGMRLAVYLKGKNAKKYRHGMEYGSARWGGPKDIEPFMAPKFEDNIILTKTERLMMSNRPPDPKNARNKNVLVVGGSGSGKTRFFIKPNLLQCDSKNFPVSFVVTDPKGSIGVECGEALLKHGYKLKFFNTIRVWSTQEGEQRFDNHTDKLLNYIRFWQADGESEKTSVRTRTSLRQLVEEGHFKGGSAPYGYDLVKSGRINKRKHELYELHINEQEAEVVRLIFDKYVYEGYGAQRIATYLNNAGYRARSGKCWHPGSLRGMVGNLTYMGVLRCGDARSELMPELQIIPQEEFEAAQRIREDRSAHAAEEAEHHVPLRTRGQALLSNNVYCGHCGARLALTTSRKWRKLPDGTLDDTLRIRYTCYGKLRKQTDCTGQTGYTMHILDEIIDKMVRQIFSRLRGIPKEQLIISRYAKETAERKNHLQALQAERDKAEKDLLALKAEILAVIKGESAFPKDTLAEMIAAQEKKHTELETLCEEASAELERNAELMANVSQLYEELISYADLYDSASFEAKKMIVSQLIRRVDVYRGYQIHVDFNFDLAQYLENSDELAC